MMFAHVHTTPFAYIGGSRVANAVSASLMRSFIAFWPTPHFFSQFWFLITAISEAKAHRQCFYYALVDLNMRSRKPIEKPPSVIGLGDPELEEHPKDCFIDVQKMGMMRMTIHSEKF